MTNRRGAGWRLAAAAAAGVAAIAAGAISATKEPESVRPVHLPGIADVLSMGADPTGQQDSSPAFERALAAKDVAKLVIPCGQYRLASTVTVPYGKTLEGFGACSRIDPDGGIVALKLTGSTGGGSITTLRDFRIWQVNQHPDNVGILIDGGQTGMENWVLERLSVLGSGVTGEGKHAGTGVRSSYGLTGTIRDSVIQWWDTGVDFQPVPVAAGGLYPNANLITGSKIRVNRIGLRLVVQTGFLIGNTIEGNLHGIVSETDSRLVLAVLANHFENIGKGGTDLQHRAGRLASVGNTYVGVVEQPTVVIGNTVDASSLGDVLAFGAAGAPQKLRKFGSW